MRLEDIVAEVRDKSFTRVGVIAQDDLDIEVVPLHNGAGTWKVTLPREHHLAAALRTPGSGMVFTGPNDDVLLSGPTLNPELAISPEDPGGTVTIAGVGDGIILSEICAWPDPTNPDVTTQAVAHDERTGPVESLMHQYVWANMGHLAPTPRRNLKLRTSEFWDYGRGPTVTKKARFPYLSDLLLELASVSNIGFRVAQIDGVPAIAFQTYARRDVTGEVRLTLDNGAIAGQRIATSAPGVTHVIVAGQGELTDRQFLEVTSPASLAGASEWGRRIERFVDQRNTNDVAELTQAGVELLAEDGASLFGIQAVPSDDTALAFGRDWFLGDLVTVEVEGIETTVPVGGAVLRANSDGVKLGITLGDDLAFKSNRDRRIVAGFETRLSALERAF